jgi:hypothetical protein
MNRRPCNGEVQIALPGRLLFFRAPSAALPPGVDWSDESCSRRQHFSAGFYAGLLRDLGATLVLALDHREG